VKIWYQAYNASGLVDPEWHYFDEACAAYIPKIARPDTEIHFAWVEKRAPKMTLSKYIQYLHVGQIIECAMQAEREGFDAFVLGGMRDLGYAEIREVVDIPVVFMAETSYLVAGLLAPRFSLIHIGEGPLQDAMALIKKYGLEDRCLPGAHIGYSHTGLIAACESEPERVVKEVHAAGRTAIKQGCGVLVTGFAPLSVFLAAQGIRQIDGVPILDSQAAVIKAAEMMVDFRRLGMPKPRKGPQFDVSAQDIKTARNKYGLR
jgi:allantoin racemase